MDSTERTPSPALEVKEQPWKKWLASELGEVVEGEAKMPWQTWKPNPSNPGEKPWLIWNAGENGEAAGMRDDRPGNVTCYTSKLNEAEK